jgi:flagellar hook-associated protein 3 FlgL
MRITQAATYLNFLRDLQLTQERTAQAQAKVTTGKRFSRPSEDPAATTDVLRLSAENLEAVQFQNNLASASSRLQAADSVLDGVENMVERIRNLALQSLSNPETAKLYTTEIHGLRDQILSAANTSHQGVFIFGGTVTNTPPFTKAADSSVTYDGNSTPLSFQVSRTMTLQAQIPGDQIFTGSVDIFSAINDVEQAMQDGDADAIRAKVQVIEDYFDVLSTARGHLGSTINLADQLTSEYTSSGLARAKELDQVQSANMAQAISELTLSQTSLQTTLAVGARLSQLSLLDYLK